MTTVDSLSSMDIPAWGYGLRYQYGSKWDVYLLLVENEA